MKLRNTKFKTPVLLAAIAFSCLSVLPTSAQAATSSQKLFKKLLLKDSKTSSSIKNLLRGDGYIDERIIYRDLTEDGRLDAVVQVQSGGVAGSVAVYIFSSDGRSSKSTLRVHYRDQNLFRVSNLKVVNGPALRFLLPNYSAGESLCCASQATQKTVKWDNDESTFKVTKETKSLASS